MRDAFNREEILEENYKDGQETWYTLSVSFKKTNICL